MRARERPLCRPLAGARRGSAIALLTLAALGLLACSGAEGSRPHIVILLADDLGWGDVGYHGSEIRTPHIDRIARSGVRLHQYYTMQVCSAARAALLTGRHPLRYGLDYGVVRFVGPHGQGLPLDERTLPAALQEVGYWTAIVGKWHLGHRPPDYRPLRRGFDHQYGSYSGHLDYFHRLHANVLDWYRNQRPVQEKGYTTDLIADEAIRLIRAHDPRVPLFLYVPFTAPHVPLQAPPRCVEPYEEEIHEPERRVYAGMVTCLDEAIGRIRETLEESGLLDDTLLLFTSDNGGAEYRGGARNAPLRGGKRTLYEGGVRVPAVVSWPGVLPAGQRVDEPVDVLDWYPTLLRLAGAPLTQAHPVDGSDVWAVLAEGAPSPDEEIVFRVSGPLRAIRRGDWKLVVQEEEGRTELFDLAHDPYEEHDLYHERPERARELESALAFWVAQVRGRRP